MREHNHIKFKKRVMTKRVFIQQARVINTITETPLDLKTGIPITKKTKIEERKNLHRGWHTYWHVLLEDNYRGLYLRELIT